MIWINRTRWVVVAAAILMAATVVSGLFLGFQTQRQFGDIAQSWTIYADDAEKKGVWISSLRGYLGYGGIIHTFKNYVIRKDDTYRTRMLDQLAQFDAVMASYLADPLPRREREALETIRRTIEEYRAKLEIAERAARARWPAERTDRLVKVDDTDAILALKNLETIWRENRRLSTERMIAAVSRGESLIAIGFVAMFLLVLAATALAFLFGLLVRDIRRTMSRLSAELTARKLLERSEQRLAEAVEQSPVTILITDTTGRIQYVNKRFEDISGWTRQDVIGQTPKFLQSGDTAPQGYQRMWESLGDGQVWRGMLRNLRKDGSSFWADTSILPLRGTDGQVHSYVGIGEDVTDRRKAREQVARAQKLEAVGLLAGGIAHDFNNILTSIIGSAHLAAIDAKPGSGLAQEIEQIEIGARRAQALIRQLLGFARREPGKADPTDLCLIIAEVVRLMRAATPPTVTISGAEDCEQATVLADPTHLHQILMNLCTNAVEAIGGHPGTIRISTERVAATPEGLAPREHGWIRLVIADDGPGISEETQTRIFDAFFTTKPLGKGSGLGLAVVHGLVQDMGGLVSVESAPGQGASFCVVLPGAPKSAAAGEVVRQAMPRGHERVMIVDDQAEIASTFRRILLRLGYKVEAFSSPSAALAAFMKAPARFDLLVSDVVMPEMSGVQMAEHMRARRADLPVVFCTGFNPSGVKLAGPAPIVLDKPVDPDDLAQHVRSAIDRAATA